MSLVGGGQAGTEVGAQAKQKWSWGEAVVLERGVQDKYTQRTEWGRGLTSVAR